MHRYHAKWYKLDNAAKVFPAVANLKRTYMFRVGAVLKEDVDKDILQQALNEIVTRFPSFNVRIRRGIFWYYFEANHKKPIVSEENPFIGKYLVFKDNNDFLFRTLHYGKRLSLEVFHSITDGTGALEFLKALIYHYLKLKGHEISSEGLVITSEIEILKEEEQDSFIKNYDKSVKVYRKEAKAYHLKGTNYDEFWQGIIHGIIDVNDLKPLAKEKGVTITEYLCGVITYCVYITELKYEKTKRAFRFFLPVNLRKFFDSKTLRNFALFVRTTQYLSGKDLTFDEILEDTTTQIRDGLVKEKLLAALVSNVKFEKNILMRITPLFIKIVAMRIGYKILGEDVNTVALSNLGVVELPEAMKEHISHFEFSIGASAICKKNAAVATYNNKLVISFSTLAVERALEREFFRFLSAKNVKIIVESNELEV